MRSYRNLILVGALVLVPGCSGGDEPEEPAGEASGDEGPAEPPPPADEAKEAEEPANPAPAAAAEPAAATAPTPTPPPPPPAPAAPAAPAAPEAPDFSGPKVTRFVATYAINVRTQPTKSASTVGWVKQGDKVNVVISGDWAKLGEGRFIASKYLAEGNPGPYKGTSHRATKAKAKKAKRGRR